MTITEKVPAGLQLSLPAAWKIHSNIYPLYYTRRRLFEELLE